MKFINTLFQWARQLRSPAHRRGTVALVAGLASVGGVASYFLGGPS